jgi:hypothetical protein
MRVKATTSGSGEPTRTRLIHIGKSVKPAAIDEDVTQVILAQIFEPWPMPENPEAAPKPNAPRTSDVRQLQRTKQAYGPFSARLLGLKWAHNPSPLRTRLFTDPAC